VNVWKNKRETVEIPRRGKIGQETQSEGPFGEIFQVNMPAIFPKQSALKEGSSPKFVEHAQKKGVNVSPGKETGLFFGGIPGAQMNKFCL